MSYKVENLIKDLKGYLNVTGESPEYTIEILRHTGVIITNILSQIEFKSFDMESAFDDAVEYFHYCRELKKAREETTKAIDNDECNYKPKLIGGNEL